MLLSSLGRTFVPVLRVENVLVDQVRTKMRFFFRYPSETKRIRKQGWKARLANPWGKRIIMKKMLANKMNLTHI